MLPAIIIAIAGAYLILGALTLHTKNFMSAFIFKIVPAILGASLLAIASDMMNFITINNIL